MSDGVRASGSNLTIPFARIVSAKCLLDIARLIITVKGRNLQILVTSSAGRDSRFDPEVAVARSLNNDLLKRTSSIVSGAG